MTFSGSDCLCPTETIFVKPIHRCAFVRCFSTSTFVSLPMLRGVSLKIGSFATLCICSRMLKDWDYWKPRLNDLILRFYFDGSKLRTKLKVLTFCWNVSQNDTNRRQRRPSCAQIVLNVDKAKTVVTFVRQVKDWAFESLTLSAIGQRWFNFTLDSLSLLYTFRFAI